MRKTSWLVLVAIAFGTIGYLVAFRLWPTSEKGGPREHVALPLEATWTVYDDLPLGTPPRRLAPDDFDRVRSGMTLAEIVQLLGRGGMHAPFEGCGIIRWSCADGRELAVWPTTYRPREVIRVGGGTGGIGGMAMTADRDRRAVVVAEKEPAKSL